jgi:hypothetical protein
VLRGAEGRGRTCNSKLWILDCSSELFFRREAASCSSWVMVAVCLSQSGGRQRDREGGEDLFRQGVLTSLELLSQRGDLLLPLDKFLSAILQELQSLGEDLVLRRG